ncbi:UDP-N-acetylmuramoyl-L-alanyl-D-glutamate--2,6-diaminopimelate ligase [Alloscardovia theropitheci]|uniref:UDP-N-acetylmuramoyl-L-alanyl-D-glutamate--2, 6-diaminopimelate ligase n=1 Tax=Alloscardovia theropitheci TaxID=2496842 RepID=A0A4V2MTV4_9BIFI|nr:UDP-N-acetylmuramoyl-L-alanyl-D-glutamate--2,6-diaminopimelate ligase [Alloscardovia theropitheci]TCD53939.1 UDP-N-acetylmuramoyl-L-alanyl-D-glutamate--2,6-diaminopimelate ligase [Alloscardovia theropitheci]
MPQITLKRVIDVLDNFNLLEHSGSYNAINQATCALDSFSFDSITYSSNDVTSTSLLICKGNFKDAYMCDAVSRGLTYYVADHEFSVSSKQSAKGIIVTDTRKALVVIAQEFYGHPERLLTTIGITGTKGKSTTAFFTHAILNDYFTHKAALISSVSNCIDGVHAEESQLTTPESLDLYRMLRQAVDNGLTHAVIEVSSQAYKVDRVFNLRFNIGAFLNISPDHISPIEHPSFEDYFACKRQIISHSDALVCSADIAHRDVIDADIVQAHIPAYFVSAQDIDRSRVHLAIPGEFNYANAAVAIRLAQLAGVPSDSDSIEAINSVKISGRMEVFIPSNSTPQDASIIAVVDFAHNGISTSTLLDFVESTYGQRNPYITVVTGSAGNKGVNRREEIVHAAQDRINRFIFTADDTDTEPVEDICQQMDHAVTNESIKHEIIIDRLQAVTTALSDAISRDGFDVVLVIGKGNEHWIKVHNKHVDYEGDDAIVTRMLG